MRALEAPSPIAEVIQENPHWLAHGAGKVRDRRVHGDDKIELCDQRGCVCKIGDRIAVGDESEMTRSLVYLRSSFTGLQGDKVDPVDTRELRPLRKPRRAQAISGVFGAACPGEADAQARLAVCGRKRRRRRRSETRGGGV